MSGYQPNSWNELRLLGRLLRGDECNGDEGYDETKLFLDTLRKGTVKEQFDAVEKLSVGSLGTLGRLALCNTEGIKKPAALLMAAIHVLLLYICREELKISCTCVGSEEEENDWNSEECWPELLPEGWILDEGQKSFAFRYKLSRGLESSPGEGSSSNADKIELLLKGMSMGESVLILNGLVLSSGSGLEGVDAHPPFSCSLSVCDFVAMSTRFKGEPYEILSSKNDNSGFCEIITRASMLQLSKNLQECILGPLLVKYFPSPEQELKITKKTQSTHIIQPPLPCHNDPNARYNEPPAPQVGGPAAGYGASDLFPNFGFSPIPSHGGMHFGPHNPAFDRYFPSRSDQLPPGTPPGARFDPFGPTIGGQPGPQFGPRRGGHRGGPTGEPSPDHLPPPGADNAYL